MTARVLFILIPEDFKDIEFSIPYHTLIENGYHIDVAGLKPGHATGVDGMTHTPNLLLSTLHEKELSSYDALVIPGGPGSTKHLWGNKEIQKIVQFFFKHHKLIATICYACIVPVQAGILTNKKATVYPTKETLTILKQHNVIYIDQGIIGTETNIITCQGPKFVEHFAHEINIQLKNRY